MVIIDRLIGQNGDALGVLGLSAAQGLVDLSDDAWSTRLEVLKGLSFDRVRIANVEMSVNFVECGFRESEFISLVSEGHFWGTSDHWERCRFERMRLLDPISPMNRFVNCSFRDSALLRYEPYQTMFDRCEFERTELKGLKAQLIQNRINRNPALSDSRANLLFNRCRFKNVSFENCLFRGVEFRDCQFEAIQARGCDFAGVESDLQWWADQKSDPFTDFLLEVLDMIRVECGASSKTYSAFEQYVLNYKTGKTANRDYSACLYSGDVPDADLDRIEDRLDEIAERYPF